MSRLEVLQMSVTQLVREKHVVRELAPLSDEVLIGKLKGVTRLVKLLAGEMK